MRSFPRRRRWLIPAVIAAVIFIGGVAANLVANDLQEAVKPYRRWVWVIFAVALVMAIIAAIRDESFSKDTEASSTTADAQPAFAAIETTHEATNEERRQIFSLPFPRNAFFTGREDVLKRLHTKFKSGERIQALNGVGGIGKTQTAIEYAARHRQDYKVVLWAGANTRETLVADYAAIAGLLDLPEKDAQDQGEAVANSDIRAQAEAISTMVDGLPLALDQAAAFILENRASIISAKYSQPEDRNSE